MSVSAERRALIVEDDPEIARLLRLHLADLNCSADVAARGDAALTLAERIAYDLVLLDLGLPDADGVDICRRLRAPHRPYLPILILSARSAEHERVIGLESGADDYLGKPFSVPELRARVRALLRRADAMTAAASGSPAAAAVRRGALCVELDKRRVTLDDDDVPLTAKEFDLLAFLAARPGRVFSRAQLLDQVWGHGHDGYEHTVNSHINRLRGKIERCPAKPVYVLTVWGVGYKFTERA